MLSKSTKYKLFQLLKAISDNEIIVEEQRQQLGRQADFEPYAAFKRIEAGSIENKGKNVISAGDVCHFLRDNQVDYVKETDLF